MATALVLTFREAVEAALIIGILMSLVKKTAHSGRGATLVCGGAVAAVLVSLGVAQSLGEAYRAFGSSVEGIAGVLAVALLSYMVFWMGEQARDLQRRLKERATAILSRGQWWALALLAFFSVLREGIETVIFLLSATEATPSSQVVTGAAAGVLAAALLALLLFRGLAHVDLKRFFSWTAYLLIVFGAGILGKATAALQAAGWLPGTIAAWDSSWLLSESSPAGALLSGLVGYAASPTLLQLYVYLGYLLAALTIFSFERRPERASVLEYADPFQPLGHDYTHPLYRLLRGRWMPRLPMLLLTLVFVALMAVGFWSIPVGPFTGQGELRLGPFAGKADNNLFIFLVWVIWLPLISISAALVGRFWCGNLCPLRLLTESAARLGERLRGRASPAAPYMRAGWILPTSFILVTVLVRVYDFQSRARDGVYLFLAITVLALVVGLFFRLGTWCRYVCPIGGWLARIARLSILGVRPRSTACAICSSRPCLRGNQVKSPATRADRCPVFLAPNRLESSQHCLQCWNCVKNCPEELSSMRLGFRFPGAELFKPYAPDLGEAVYITALLGMYVAVTLQGLLWPDLPFLVTLAVLMGLPALGYLALAFLVSKLAGIPWREVLTTVGYSFLPMEFATAVIVMGDDSLEFFNILVPAAAVLLGLGFSWSVALGASILLHRAPDKRRAMAGYLPVALSLFLLLLFWAVRFLSGEVIDLT